MREVLRVCWKLTQEIRNERGRLKELREMAAALVKEADGLPRSESRSSKVEKLTILIVDSENRIAALKAVKSACVMELYGLINAAIDDSVMRAVLLYRNGYCKTFRAISRELGYSERRIYQLHCSGMKKFQYHFSVISV